MQIEKLQPGDVLFYRTTRTTMTQGIDGLSVEELRDDFAAAAAITQTYPYSLRRNQFLPWHHVAVYVGDGRVVGFAEAAYQSGGASVATPPVMSNTTLDLEDLNANHVTIDVLRPPTPQIGRNIAHVSEVQAEISVPYALVGLLAFSLATIAWITPKSELREHHMREAFGAAALARKLEATGETCTTAVARATTAAVGVMTFEPPPVIPRCHRAPPKVTAIIDAALTYIRSRVTRSQLSGVLCRPSSDGSPAIMYRAETGDDLWLTRAGADLADATSALAHDSFLDAPSIRSGLARTRVATAALALPDERLDELGLPEQPWVMMPGNGTPTDPVSIAVLLKAGIARLGGISLQDLARYGAASDQIIRADNAMLSPAMLWQSLEVESFEELGTLQV